MTDRNKGAMMIAKGCPGANVFKEPRPEYIDCPHCGQETEIWSDEPIAPCEHCGQVVSQSRGASCIDWCQHAVQCIGAEKYERLRQTEGGVAGGVISQAIG
jgi:hypothetical protein